MAFDALRGTTKDRTVHNDSAAASAGATNSTPQAATAFKAGKVAKPAIAKLNNEKNYSQEIGTASKEDQRKMEAILNPKTYGDYLEFRKLMSPEKPQACNLADDHKFDKL